MKRRNFVRSLALGAGYALTSGVWAEAAARAAALQAQYELVVVGGTPAGIMAAIAAARAGLTKILILERTTHIGGLPANGLGATDIATKGGTGGLFMEFVNNIKAHYVKKYGAESQQVKDCSNGYHFEPSVAEKVLLDMIAAEGAKIKVLYQRQLETCALSTKADAVLAVGMQNIQKGVKPFTPKLKLETYTAAQFVDGTYEGDLMAMAKVPFVLGREAKSKYNELGAGKIYKYWKGPEGAGSTGEGDDTIQAYNYRMCLTDNPANRRKIEKPATYNREEYVSLIDDLHTGRFTGVEMMQVTEQMLADNKAASLQGIEAKLPGLPRGLRRLLNPVKLPNGKTDSNNQHWAFISSDLPEENWPYPTASWQWRDNFAKRLRDYTLGLIYFAQNDPEVPQWYRDQIKEWGLAADEYTDNENFPRQVYVREGRRMQGMYFFKAQDALPPGAPENLEGRPPLHANSITASHYALDSHACYKREPGRVHLEGFLSFHTQPYTVPAGVILPEKVKNLSVPVAVSGSHIGFSTLRMEPCWMALGQAAGIMAALAIKHNLPLQAFNSGAALHALQDKLIAAKAILIYVSDVPADHPAFSAVQKLALLGAVPAFALSPAEPITQERALKLMEPVAQKLGKGVSELVPAQDYATKADLFMAVAAKVSEVLPKL